MELVITYGLIASTMNPKDSIISFIPLMSHGLVIILMYDDGEVCYGDGDGDGDGGVI